MGGNILKDINKGLCEDYGTKTSLIYQKKEAQYVSRRIYWKSSAN